MKKKRRKPSKYPKGIPADVRRGVVWMWRDGIRIWEIAKTYEISERSVSRIVKEDN